ncbi:hypothetical protein SAMN02910358_01073 [Lachnospiraceae bacterium XBB1006]|nr:hypothetical protein SAMN02910358_01073 [Lachnospiraceae bacterium XBB1006]
MKKRVKAAVTVEATIALFLICMFLACLLLLFPAMKKEMVHTRALISVAQEGGCVSAIRPNATAGFLTVEGNRKVREVNRGKRPVVLALPLVDGSSMTVTDSLHLPFGFAERLIKPRDVFYVRYWQGFLRERDADAYVYISKTGTVYHRWRSCYHLLVTIHSVTKENVNSCRNQDGAKYYPCENCGRYAGNLVYITPEGNRYHSRKNCKNLLRFIKRVPLSEVQATHRPCKHCGGKEEYTEDGSVDGSAVDSFIEYSQCGRLSMP